MNYIKRIFNWVLVSLNNNLTIFEKIIYFLLSILFITLIIIYFVNTYPYFALFIAFVLFLISIYLLIKNLKSNSTVNTDGGDYNELIQGHYVKGNYNINHINIQGNSIDSSQNLSQVISEIQDILAKMLNRGYNIEEAVKVISNDLLLEIKNKPKIKINFVGNEDVSDDELIAELIHLITYENSTNFEDNNYYETISYKGYMIYLEIDKDNWWHYRINGLIFDNTGSSFSKRSAIDEAKGKIDEERFRNW